MATWAHHFYEIPDAVGDNNAVRDTSVRLIETESISAQAVDGGDRESVFKDILTAFLSGDIGFEKAKQQVTNKLPAHQSPHAHNSRVFNSQWEDRLVRSEGSRFYNHAVLLTLKERGDETCYVPESPHQDPTKKCTQLLAGGEASVPELIDGLERAFRDQDWDAFPRIPYKPNCTHTITPTE